MAVEMVEVKVGVGMVAAAMALAAMAPLSIFLSSALLMFLSARYTAPQARAPVMPMNLQPASASSLSWIWVPFK